MPTFTRILVFGDKNYYYKYAYRKKKDAEKFRDKLKKDDYNVRIVPRKWHWDNWYVVYARKRFR